MMVAKTKKWAKSFWVDLAERVGATALGALLTLLTMDAQFPNLGWDRLWPVLVLPTLIAAIKGLLANLASPGSGASLVPPPEGPQV